MPAESSQTLDRGLHVLKFLIDSEDGLPVAELADRLGVARSVVYRLLATLEQHALVRCRKGRARLTLGVLRLTRHSHQQLRRAALPVLRSLADDLGATAHLTLFDGSEALVVEAVEPRWTDVHITCRPGLRHPLDDSAAGRAIRSTLGLPEGTRTDPPYALTTGEEQPGICGAAAGLVGLPEVAGCVGVVMLPGRIPDGAGPRVVQAAAAVTDALR
ncbi:helix-turn-helix domain-containing protein [Streptomyces sp. NPDC047085]|uniref:IclR family transcriptional regulator n=1 Tax=Streptomyces sp. NPDC047085 TaxID=3155140 RepID=UPI0033EAFD16